MNTSDLRSLILVPVVVGGGAFVGFLACTLGGVDPHERELILAAVACALAAEAGIVPLILTRRASQVAVAQAGLAGTLLHLLVAAAMAGVLHLVVRLGPPVLYWMLPFYWLTLSALVVLFVKAVKSAPSVGSSPRASKQ